MPRAGQVKFFREAAEKRMCFARVVRAGDLLFISGTTSTDDEGNVVGPGDMIAQTRHVYGLLKKILALHDATFEHVIKETTFVTDIDAALTAAPVRAAAYEDHEPPAATLVEISRLVRPGMMIEVELVASIAVGQ